MSFYSGRYNLTHGATYNNFPLRIDEKTIGDYLRPQGYRTVLVGKTHFKPDLAVACSGSASRPGANPGLPYWQCGFEPFERDDGLHPEVDGKLARRRPRLQPLAPPARLFRREPLARVGELGRRRQRRGALGLVDAQCAAACTGEGGALRDRLHDRPRHRVHVARPVISPGACTSPTSSRTGPTSRPRLITRCTDPSMSSRPTAAKPSAAVRIP